MFGSSVLSSVSWVTAALKCTQMSSCLGVVVFFFLTPMYESEPLYLNSFYAGDEVVCIDREYVWECLLRAPLPPPTAPPPHFFFIYNSVLWQRSTGGQANMKSKWRIDGPRAPGLCEEIRLREGGQAWDRLSHFSLSEKWSSSSTFKLCEHEIGDNLTVLHFGPQALKRKKKKKNRSRACVKVSFTD